LAQQNKKAVSFFSWAMGIDFWEDVGAAVVVPGKPSGFSLKRSHSSKRCLGIISVGTWPLSVVGLARFLRVAHCGFPLDVDVVWHGVIVPLWLPLVASVGKGSCILAAL
jgi:hypothetical protein